MFVGAKIVHFLAVKSSGYNMEAECRESQLLL